MRHITQNGIDLIKRFEGFSAKVYMCSAGYPTIGYGHVVKSYEDFSAGIDEAQAEELLRQDAVIAERAVLRLINVPLTDGQFDAWYLLPTISAAEHSNAQRYAVK